MTDVVREISENHLHHFEGPEKRFEIDFFPNPASPRGMKLITRPQWDAILELAKCTILSMKSNEHVDSYVLSESSLFVYSNKVILKTCGTTTLLHAVVKIVEHAVALGMQVEMVMYSRKNFSLPEAQHFPHKDFRTEVAFLNEIFDGTAHILGSLTDEHWLLYIADYSNRKNGNLPDRPNEHMLEIMMHDLDPAVTKKFFKTADKKDCAAVVDIHRFVPGSIIDEFSFDPCGYSMNGLLDESIWTIHVTPEDHCSFASFETNMCHTNYKALIHHVLSYFKPASATIAVFTKSINLEPGWSCLLPLMSLVIKSLTEL